MYVCSERNCPTLTRKAGRCTIHTREKDRARGTSTQRGYGTKHMRIRADWVPKVATGTVKCWRCQTLIDAMEPWDLGHSDDDRDIYRGPEHRKCNRSAAGRASRR